MNRYTFFLNIEGLGDTPKEAWEDAIERMVGALKEYADPPSIIYGPDDAIEGAEILNGPPYQEFGIDHGAEGGPT